MRQNLNRPTKTAPHFVTPAHFVAKATTTQHILVQGLGPLILDNFSQIGKFLRNLSCDGIFPQTVFVTNFANFKFLY
jgi:hypothetical protein